MNGINIAAVANQEFTIQLDDAYYDIALRTCAGCVVVDITRDDVEIVTGQRVVPGTPLLPYRFQEEGNFILTTQVDALPDFTQFGVTQFLVYVTEAELATFRVHALPAPRVWPPTPVVSGVSWDSGITWDGDVLWN